jgi:hypothetical protein
MTRNGKKYTSTLNYRKNRKYEPRPRSSVWHCPPPLVPPTKKYVFFSTPARAIHFGLSVWVGFRVPLVAPCARIVSGWKVEVGLDSESHSDSTFRICHDHATANNVLARNLSRKDRMDGERCNYSGAYTYIYYRVHILRW